MAKWPSLETPRSTKWENWHRHQQRQVLNNTFPPHRLHHQRSVHLGNLLPRKRRKLYGLPLARPTSVNPSQLQLKTKTAGKDWFDLPAPAEADLPRLYREYEALRLRNHLDPKRFYRKDEGEGRGIKGLPKYFAVCDTAVSPSEYACLFDPWNRLGRSFQQRRRSGNRQAEILRVRSVNVRWLKSSYTTRKRRVTQRRSSSRCKRFGEQMAGDSMRKRRRVCDKSGDLSPGVARYPSNRHTLRCFGLDYGSSWWQGIVSFWPHLVYVPRVKLIRSPVTTLFQLIGSHPDIVDIMASLDPTHAYAVKVDDTFELYDLRVEIVCPPNERILCGAKDGDYFLLEGEMLKLPPGQGISIYSLSTLIRRY